MSKRPWQIGGGLLALLALVLVAAGLVALSQFRGGPAIWLRLYDLQSSGPSQACAAPAALVPGSYQAGPAQYVGGFVLLTYSAGCAEPGQPAQGVEGFAALDPQGVGCARASELPPSPSAGAVTAVSIDGVSSGQCGAFDVGGGLSVVIGRVTGSGVTSVQVEYSSGFKTTTPLYHEHFGLGSADSSGVCAVRALSASGAVLAQTSMGGLGTGSCP